VCYQFEGWRQYYVVHAAYESSTLTDDEKAIRQQYPMLGYAMLFGGAIRGNRKQLTAGFRGVVAPNWSDIALGQTYLFTPALDEITYRIVSIERDIVMDEIQVIFEEVESIALPLSWVIVGNEGSGNGSIGSNAASSPGSSVSVWSVTANALTGNTDNLSASLVTPNVYLQLSATSAYNLTGIIPTPNCVFLKIRNTGTNVVTLKNFDSGSAAANRFSIAGGDFPLLVGQTAEFIYDSLWVCCGTY
jgi:hypothetical protein